MVTNRPLRNIAKRVNIFVSTVLARRLLPDEKESVHGKRGVADSLEHEIPFCDRPQRLVLCKAQTRECLIVSNCQ